MVAVMEGVSIARRAAVEGKKKKKLRCGRAEDKKDGLRAMIAGDAAVPSFRQCVPL